MEIGTHLNGDEAMTKGASFFAANHSSVFKVRPILLTDGLNFPINVVIRTLNEADVDNEDVYRKNVTLFPIKSTFGTKKSLAFSHGHDLLFRFTTQNNVGFKDV